MKIEKRLLLVGLWLIATGTTFGQPVITSQPQSQAVILYQPAAFGVLAGGTAPLGFQWRKDGAPIAGATNDEIVLQQPRLSDAGLYSVVVANAEGSVISGDAGLTVNSPKGGDLDYSFAVWSSINGPVLSLAVQPDGKVMITGNFTAVHGAARFGIARLNADGTTDYTFMNGLFVANGAVLSVAVQSDGKMLIGGNFTTVNGVNRTNIARFNADGTLDNGFLNGLFGANGTVFSVAAQSDGKVLIGGRFTTVNGVDRTNIARFNADGTLDNGFLNGLSGVNSDVRSVAVQSDQKVLIGGSFTAVNGVNRTNVARLNADGTFDNGFQNGLSGVNDEVSSVAVQSDGKVLVGGLFTMAGDVSRTFLARLNTDGTLDTGFQNALSGSISYVSPSVAVQSDGKVLIGGYFTTVNGNRGNAVTRLNADGTLDSSFQNGLSGIDGGVSSFAVQSDGKVLIGGSFSTVNGVSRTNIARFNADGTLDNGFQPGFSGAVGGVTSIALQSDGKVLIGGWQRDPVNLVNGPYAARLNADGTPDSRFQNGLAGVVGVVASIALQSDGKVVIAGAFGTVNSVSRTVTVRLNADGTPDTGFQNAIVESNGKVISVAVQSDGKVLIGGGFYTVNGVPASSFARLNADGSLDTGFLSGVDGQVYSIALQSDGKVLIGGYFTMVNGVERLCIARLNPDGTLDSGFQTVADYGVNSISVQIDGKVLIGGDFTSVNGGSRNGIARLNADGTLDNAFQNGLTGADDFVYSVAVQSDGKVLIGGQFTSVNGLPASSFARLWANADAPPQIKSINRNGRDVNLIWYAIPNRTYRVQYTEDLSGSNWMDLAGDLSATGGSVSKTDTTLGSASQRFYRVKLISP